MIQDHTPSPIQFFQCAALIAKVIISKDGKFTKSEIALADELLECNWNNTVIDFLHVVAGSAHAAPLASCQRDCARAARSRPAGVDVSDSCCRSNHAATPDLSLQL